MVYMQKEWEPQEGKIPCLSISQPFASAIILGKKKIELRTWGTHYRGPIALHAGNGPVLLGSGIPAFALLRGLSNNACLKENGLNEKSLMDTSLLFLLSIASLKSPPKASLMTHFLKLSQELPPN